jgi:glycosyltransferase involved in cell wall biosynthesis
MKISYIGTYPPHQCGIATFTENLFKSMLLNVQNPEEKIVGDVIAVHDSRESYAYPSEVKYQFSKNNQDDYIKAADFINASGSSACIIEHEFGIFGGQSGVYILSLAHKLKVPLIVTLHTILDKPCFMEKSIIFGLGRYADKLVVMSHLGEKLLREVYEIPPHKIVRIEHGVPDLEFGERNELRKKHGFNNRKALLTFGLLGRNKGIETVINALPRVVKYHPDILYIVLGNTHPEVARISGESYRHYLEELVVQKNLGKNVLFLKQYVSEEELFKYLTAIDIYITPYINENQITSGTLSYAVGAGAAIVSSPYWHAQELLANGRGELFNFQDSDHLADVLLELLDNPEKVNQMKSKAKAYGTHLAWPLIGSEYNELCRNAAKTKIPKSNRFKSSIDFSTLQDLQLDHLARLTDDTGIVQHAKYGIPNLKEGYCLDDNSRALLATLMSNNISKNQLAADLAPIYFSYIHYMQNDKGTFRNFLSFTREFLDEEGSEDAFGRTIWALGYLIRYATKDAYYLLGAEILHKSSPNFQSLDSLRGVANSLIGIVHYLHKYHSDENMFKTMHQLTHRLVEAYKCNATKDWKWFENYLTYDNAILPMALYHVFEITRNDEVLKIANESVKFLESVVIRDGILAPVGSDGWYVKGENCAKYAQQATDVMLMVLMYCKIYEVTKDKENLHKMYKSFSWFLGENDLRIPLYDSETQGCADGLEPYGLNRNQGAESTLAYLISRMSILQATVMEHSFDEIKKKKLFKPTEFEDALV